MTATKVDTREVIETHRVESPLSTPDKPIYYTRIVELELDDATSVLGCTECDFTAETVGLVRGHLGRLHRAPADERSKPDREWEGFTLGQAVAAIGAVDRLAAERAEWKRRATTAERDLAAIRKALRGATS